METLYLVPKNYSLDGIGLTQSLIKTYMSCPRKFLLSINRFYKPSQTGKKTSFGTLMHYVIEQFYLHPLKIYERKEISTLLQKFIDEHKMDFLSILDQIEIIKLQVEIIAMAYRLYYKKDFKHKIVAVENEINLIHNDIKLRGKKDLCLEISGKLYNLDHKTTSRIDETSLVKILNFDFQHLSYALWGELQTGQKIAGCYHNLIRNPAYKTENLEAAEDKLSTEILRNPEHFFKRYIINYNDKDKNEYWKNFEIIINLIKNSLKENCFFQNSTQCTIYGECEFLDLCSTNTTVGYVQRENFFPELENKNGNSKTNKKRIAGK